MALLSHRIEQIRRNEMFHFGEQSLKLLKDRTRKVIFESLCVRAGAPGLQQAGSVTPGGSSRDAFLLDDRCKRNQEVQINLA
jgi:hypothetical protein